MPRRLTNDEFVEKARKVHGDKYDYSKVNYVTSTKKVIIICPTHGDFEQTPERHLRGRGCQKCGGTQKLTLNDFLNKAKEIHGDRYDYSKVEYINSITKVCIVCPTHGEFWQTVGNHLSGHGCPICSIENRRCGILNVAKKDMLCNDDCSVVWRGIIMRCYSKAHHEKHPSYIGCTVCDEWLTFSNFKKWYQEHYIEGFDIDKDILVKGNKVYSPQTCCFVPKEINVLFQREKERPNNLPQGVTKLHRRYRACFRDKMVGSFFTMEEANKAYINAKEDWIKTLADKYKDQLENRTYEALYNYKVEIED